MTSMPTGDLIERIIHTATRQPHSDALSATDGTTTLTWQELAHDITRTAKYVAEHVGAGGQVLVISDSGPRSYLHILGCLAAGAVTSVLETSAPTAVVESCRDAVNPSLTLTPDHTIPPTDSPGAHTTAPEMSALPPVDRSQAAILLFTSGTTGTPKGVTLPLHSFLAIPDLIRENGLNWITWDDHDTTYTPLPSSHIGGLWWILNGLAHGCHTITGHSTQSPTTVINRWAITTTCTVPAMMNHLAEDIRAGRMPATLRLVVYGGSRAMVDDVATIESTGARTAQIYGLSETGCTALCLPTGPGSLDLVARGSVGTPYPGIGIRIIADPTATPATTINTDRTGTLWIATPARMLGYYGQPRKTAETLVDGWINTGDIVEIDDDGFVYLRGRVSELIICGGANVSPDDVDSLARTIPGVADAACFAVPDDDFGAVVGVAVVADKGHDPTALCRDIAAQFRAHAKSEARPALIVVVDDLPRTASGKIRRSELTRMYAATSPNHTTPPTTTTSSTTPH